VALLDDLEAEADRLAAQASELESRCEAAEASLESSKEFNLRLSADFENFRKRSVGAIASMRWAYPLIMCVKKVLVNVHRFNLFVQSQDSVLLIRCTPIIPLWNLINVFAGCNVHVSHRRLKGSRHWHISNQLKGTLVTIKTDITTNTSSVYLDTELVWVKDLLCGFLCQGSGRRRCTGSVLGHIVVEICY
jgi:hypothetical protein